MSNYDYATLAPKPSILHRVINEEEIQRIKRLIVVGDVHGCLDELKELLGKCEYSQQDGDRVLLVGDLVNKGPYSAEVIRFAREQDMLCIRGNHDDFALCHGYALVPSVQNPSLSYINTLTR